MTTNFHLCPIGWKLNDAWVEAWDSKLSTKEKQAALEAYRKHRNECQECSDFRKEEEIHHG